MADAIKQCASDWGWNSPEEIQNIICIGIAEGDIGMLYWEDFPE